ncbi:MAG: PIN domain-containing protein [Myxococcales bacterium]|nr:PIN domain-containing protein [Myxococcales bacterium]
MDTLTDSSVIIALERGQLSAKDFGNLGKSLLVLSAITVSELLHGVHRADESRRLKREAFVESILTRARTLDFDMAAARVHAQLSAALAASGTSIGAHDLLIGSTAVAYGLRLLTRKPKDFGRIPGLKVATV